MENKNWLVGLGILAALGFAFWFVVVRKPGASSVALSNSPTVRVSHPGVSQEPQYSGGGKNYINEKTWDIEYNPDGLPTKITKHVMARIG